MCVHTYVRRLHNRLVVLLTLWWLTLNDPDCDLTELVNIIQKIIDMNEFGKPQLPTY